MKQVLFLFHFCNHIWFALTLLSDRQPLIALKYQNTSSDDSSSRIKTLFLYSKQLRMKSGLTPSGHHQRAAKWKGSIPEMIMRTASENQSLIRGITILEAYNSEKQSWGIRELSRALNINAATTYRLVSTLAKRGYLEQNAETQKYHLGPKVVQLAANYSTRNSLIEISLRVFAKYEKQFPYNFYTGVMRAQEIIYITVHESRGPLKIATEPGQRVSIYGSALGKILLANESDSFIKKLLAKNPIERITSMTVANEKSLMKQIREIRNLGYAVNLGEVYEEIAAVAMPIRGLDGAVIAGVSLSFPLHYLETKKLSLPKIIGLTQTISNEISTMNRQAVIR